MSLLFNTFVHSVYIRRLDGITIHDLVNIFFTLHIPLVNNHMYFVIIDVGVLRAPDFGYHLYLYSLKQVT